MENLRKYFSYMNLISRIDGKRKMKYSVLYCFCIYLFLISCSENIPENTLLQSINISISPDYSEITIPCNIAPLNFNINETAQEYLTVIYSSKGNKIISKGKKVKIPVENWKKLLKENQGDTLYIEIYLKKEKQWLKYPAICNYIAQETIDDYISYRLIEPSYVTYENMSINQRNLTNFDEKVIFSNRLLVEGDNEQCINCHSYKNYNQTGDWQFHVRQHYGGTVIVRDKAIQKINLKTDYTISAGVYPSWHPTENVIAYSTNKTGQKFHTRDIQKIEVMDTESDLIMYDLDKNEVSVIANDSTKLETFPSWSSDGKFLYYTSADYPEGVNKASADFYSNYEKFHYNIYRKSFNPETKEFLSTDTIFEASSYGKSATFPRESPDGRYLLFTLGDYGNFHIWHKNSDLYLMDLKTFTYRALTELNSSDADSYHSWSSNGRWIIFSSRRDDGSYTRLYIAYFKDGEACKPFIVPQNDPDFYGAFFKSYNIPEFMIKPVNVSPSRLASAIKKETLPAIYNSEKFNKKVVKQDTDDEDTIYD